MNQFNRRGLVALILFHTKCRKQNKEGQPYFFCYKYLRLDAMKESKDSDMLSLKRDVLVKKARRAIKNCTISHNIHVPMMGARVKRYDINL